MSPTPGCGLVVAPDEALGQRLVEALFTHPESRPGLLVPQLMDGEVGRQVDDVVRAAAAMLGAEWVVETPRPGVVLLTGNTRVGVFYDCDEQGKVASVELYPVEPVVFPRRTWSLVKPWFGVFAPILLGLVVVFSDRGVDRVLWSLTAVAVGVDSWSSVPWSFFGVRFRSFLALVIGALLGLSWLRPPRLIGGSSVTAWLVTGFAVVGGGLVVAAMARTPRRGLALPVQPLGGHSCYVVHGGPWRLNHHAASAEQRWAIDLVPLAGLVRREPSPNVQVPVLSPVDGVVLHAVDRYDDAREPGAVAPPTGNVVVVGCRHEGHPVQLWLCHLALGSVRVRVGDRVAAGDPVGLMGNTGRSSRPHLHLHAVRADGDGAAVPVTIAGSRPWRGRVLAASGSDPSGPPVRGQRGG